jgi:hypothetical protein
MRNQRMPVPIPAHNERKTMTTETNRDIARSIELEAIRVATLQFNADDWPELTPSRVRDIRLMLARRYDSLIGQYKFDTHEVLAQRIASDYANK